MNNTIYYKNTANIYLHLVSISQRKSTSHNKSIIGVEIRKVIDYCFGKHEKCIEYINFKNKVLQIFLRWLIDHLIQNLWVTDWQQSFQCNLETKQRTKQKQMPIVKRQITLQDIHEFPKNVRNGASYK